MSGVIHVVADRIDDLTPLLERLSEDSTGVEALAHCGEVRRPVLDGRTRPRHAGDPLAMLLQEEPALADKLAPAANVHAVMPRGRNFH